MPSLRSSYHQLPILQLSPTTVPACLSLLFRFPIRLLIIFSNTLKMTKESGNSQSGWAHGLFDCCSPGGLCLKTFFCPCLTFGKTSHLLAHNNLDSYSCCNGSVSPYHHHVLNQTTETGDNDQQSG